MTQWYSMTIACCASAATEQSQTVSDPSCTLMYCFPHLVRNPALISTIFSLHSDDRTWPCRESSIYPMVPLVRIKYLDVSLQENMSKIVTCQRLSSNYGKTYGETNDLVVRRINWWVPPVYQPAIVLSSWRLGKFQSDHPHNLSAWLKVNDFTNLPTWSKTTGRIPIYNPYPNHHLWFPIWFMVNFKKWAVKLMILRLSPHSITLW